MKKHMLKMAVISRPIVQANNRTESRGNVMPLQTISIGQRTRSILTGVAIRRALRDALEDEMAIQGKEVFRHRDVHPEGTGYGYGPDKLPSLLEAIRQAKSLDTLRSDYPDVGLFGGMAVGAKKTAENGDTTAAFQFRARSAVNVSLAVSTSVVEGDSTFHQGVNAESHKIAPYNQDNHTTRYVFALTFNLHQVPKLEWVRETLRLIVGGLQVGGNHARSDAILMPEVVLWRFFRRIGNGGLYLPAYETAVEKPVDLEPFRQQATEHDTPFEIGGSDYSNLTLMEAVDEMWTQMVDLTGAEA